MCEKIIAKERPDALLPTLGGQTGLNTAVELAKRGILEKYGVEMIGANLEAIEKAESRQQFKVAMQKIGIESARSYVAHTIEEAREGKDKIGLPLVIRPAFTMGGAGGGFAYTEEEFERIAASGLSLSPISEILIEESMVGWKEFEMEVMRDKADNVVIICSIENLDAMGIHTGDSITVAPAQTLTDKEYQRMRDASIACIREIGVETGGSNVQFAVNPADGRMIIIEMNPRVSRSSALASKATGFPIAKIAAKLAVGYTLDELLNDITRVTPGLLRAHHRLRGDQGPALHLREVPAGRTRPGHADEVRGRGHGHRPHLQGKPAEGHAFHGNRPLRPGRRRQEGDPGFGTGDEPGLPPSRHQPRALRPPRLRAGLERGAPA